MREQSNQNLGCPHCGAESAIDANYCRVCGAALAGRAETTKEITQPTLHLPSDGVTTTPIHEPVVTEIIGPGPIDAPIQEPIAVETIGPGPIDAEAVLSAMSVLQTLARKKVEQHGPIFGDYHFIFILHLLSDLLGFMEAFRQLGMDWQRAQFLYKPYLYRYKERIAHQLETQGAGVNALTTKSLETIVGNILKTSHTDRRKIIIVEDGGYVVPLVHRVFNAELGSFQGAVEQTTKGISADMEVAPLRFPLLDVANARVKREKESPQIALAVWDNVRRLLSGSHHDLTRPKVLVVGYGSIGMHLAEHLRSYGAIVKVFDQERAKRDQAAAAGFIVDDEIKKLVEREHGLIVIGATGKTSIGEEEILALEHDSILVSASSDQLEIGTRELHYLSTDPKGTKLTDPRSGEKVGDIFRINENRNEITLLAEGYPINFWNTESMRIKVSQVAMVPLFLSTVALITRRAEIGVGQPNSELVDLLVEEEHVYERL